MLDEISKTNNSLHMYLMLVPGAVCHCNRCYPVANSYSLSLLVFFSFFCTKFLVCSICFQKKNNDVLVCKIA